MKSTKFKSIFAWFILLLTFLFFLVLLAVAQDSNASETWTRTFSRTLQGFFGPVISLIPFAITEWLFGLGVTYLIYQFTKALQAGFKSKWDLVFNRALKMTNLSLITITFYYGTAGIAYQRLPLPFNLYQETVEKTSFENIILHFITDFNETASRLNFNEEGHLLSPYSYEELNTLMVTEFERLPDDYFTDFTPRVKLLLTSFLFTEFNITGVSVAITTEPMINKVVPWASIPFTMAHELAHAKGVMREEDANLVALYITLQSDIDFIRYSGYFDSMPSLLNLANYTGVDQHRQWLVNQLSPTIRLNYQAYGDFWKNYQWLNEFARSINDLYLKILGNEGVVSYNDEEETEVIIDEGVEVEIIVNFSPYQKLYFQLYFH